MRFIDPFWVAVYCNNRLKRARRDPSLPTQVTAMEVESLSAEWGHALMSARNYCVSRDANAIIKRSAMLGIERKDLEAAKERRGASEVKLANIKMVRQVFYREDTDKVGTRFFKCFCTPCMQRNFAECLCKEWTKGEPTWQAG